MSFSIAWDLRLKLLLLGGADEDGIVREGELPPFRVSDGLFESRTKR